MVDHVRSVEVSEFWVRRCSFLIDSQTVNLKHSSEVRKAVLLCSEFGDSSFSVAGDCGSKCRSWRYIHRDWRGRSGLLKLLLYITTSRFVVVFDLIAFPGFRSDRPFVKRVDNSKVERKCGDQAKSNPRRGTYMLLANEASNEGDT